MNQSLGYEIDAVMPELRTSGLLTSRCTIQEPDGLSTPSGAPSGQYYPVQGLADIPCKDAPPESAGAFERRNEPQTLTEIDRRVLLDGYYPTVLIGWRQAWRALIDGEAFDIAGAEADSHRTQTRLLLRKVTV